MLLVPFESPQGGLVVFQVMVQDLSNIEQFFQKQFQHNLN